MLTDFIFSAGILYHHTNEQSDNLIILQVVVQLPPLETSTSTAEALLRNLRPTRSQSMNPSKAKKEKPIATLVDALVFYVSIREDILLSRRDRKSEKRIIIQLSDDRGLAIIRDAVTLDDSTISPERGRRRSTNGTNGGLKRDSVGKSLNCSPVHSRAGSRAASESRFAVFGHAFGLLGL